MFVFRKLSLHDIALIYEDMELKPLLTVKPMCQKIGVVMDIDGCLKGGITGYIDREGAMIQKLKIKKEYATPLCKDGLIRSLIHALDLNGIKLLFTKKTEDIDIYTNIGFKKIDSIILDSNIILGDIIKKDIGRDHIFFINLKDFFNKNSCNRGPKVNNMR